MKGTYFKTELCIRDTYISSVYELKELIEETKSDINNYEKRLMYLIGAGQEVVPDDWKEESDRFMEYRLREIMEEYTQDVLKLDKLKELLYIYEEAKNKGEEIDFKKLQSY